MTGTGVRARIWAMLALGGIALAGAASACRRSGGPEPAQEQPRDAITTVYVVRHTERASDADDAPLSPRGHARARALAELMRERPVDAIYATRYRRTQQTVAPLAEARALPIARATPRGAELLARHRGQAVLVAGHSNTVPRLLAELGVREPVVIDADDYGELFVVRTDGAAATLERLSFGLDR